MGWKGSMRRADAWLILPLLCAASACQRPEPMQARAGDVAESSPASGLERAAIETGVVADAARMSPVGLFARRHEAGRDALCLIPDGAKPKHFAFGLETMFGSDEYCRGHGVARRTGDKLVLQFSGRTQCIVVADYEGDRVAMPGVADMKCADLCKGRGSLEGVTFPRLASDASSALAAKDRDGAALCVG